MNTNYETKPDDRLTMTIYILIGLSVLGVFLFFGIIFISSISISPSEYQNFAQILTSAKISPLNLAAFVLSLIVWYTTLMLFALGYSSYKNSKDFKDYNNLHEKIIDYKYKEISKNLESKHDNLKSKIENLIQNSIIESFKEPPDFLLKHLKKEYNHALKLYGELTYLSDTSECHAIYKKIEHIQKSRYREIEHDWKTLMVLYGNAHEIESGLSYLHEKGNSADIQIIIKAKAKMKHYSNYEKLIMQADLAIKEIERNSSVRLFAKS